MKVAIRYFSRTGSTKRLALAIQEQLGIAAEPIDIPICSEVELLFLGTATYGGRLSREVFDFISTLKDRDVKVVAFSSSVFRKSNYNFLSKQLSKVNIPLVTENFHCGSRFHLLHRKRLNETDLENIKNFAREIVRKYLK